MTTKLNNSKFQRSVVVTGGMWPSGYITNWGGLFWVLMGLSDIDVGDVAVMRSDQLVEVTKKNQSDTFSDRENVFYDVALQAAVTSGGDGILGKCVGGSTSSESSVSVLMNSLGGSTWQINRNLATFAGNKFNLENLMLADGETLLWAYRKDDSIQTLRYNMRTEAETSEVQVYSGSSVDPVLLQFDANTIWCLLSNNIDPTDRAIEIYSSTDNGDTWASVERIGVSGTAGHYEDLSIIRAPNGDILLSAEYEIADKGASEIRLFRYTGGAWQAFTTPVPQSGTVDYEGWYMFRLESEPTKVFAIYAFNDAGGELSYDHNRLYFVESSDSGVTWSAPKLLEDSTSHVEYSAKDVNGELWITDSRNFGAGHVGAAVKAGIIRKPSLQEVTRNWQSYAEAGKSSAFFYITDGVDTWLELYGYALNGIGFVGRDASGGSGTVVTITTELSCNSDLTSPGPGVRAWWGPDDENHYLLLRQGTDLQIFERTAGAYTLLDTETVPATVSGQRYSYVITWNKSTGAITVTEDGTLYNNFTDSTHGTLAEAGVSCGGDDSQMPVRCYGMRVEDEAGLIFDDPFTTSPMREIVSDFDQDRVIFAKSVFEFDNDFYLVIEDRENQRIQLYRYG